MKLCAVLLVLAGCGGYDPCPGHTHQVDAGVCECDPCFNLAGDGGTCEPMPAEPGCGGATR
jgi:hypothetical protein